MKLSAPSPIVLMRTVRPHLKVVITLIWIYTRLVYQKSRVQNSEICLLPLGSDGRNSSASYEDYPQMECQHLYFNRGLLDHIYNAFTALTNVSAHFILKQTGSAFLHRFTSTMYLFANDVFGIVLMISLLRIIQKIKQYTFLELKEQIIQSIFDFAKENISFVKNELKNEEIKMEKSLKETFWKGRQTLTKVLPKHGVDIASVLDVRLATDAY